MCCLGCFCGFKASKARFAVGLADYIRFHHLLTLSKSDVIAQVLEDMPPDPTSLEDMIHAALFTGDPLKALDHAAKLDPWLSAHLADMMEPLALVDKDPNEE